MQEIEELGATQRVHCLVATYTEDVALVRECVLRLLVAPEPLYMQKIVYVCDDGHALPGGDAKRRMCEELTDLGAPFAALDCDGGLCCSRLSCAVRCRVVLRWPVVYSRHGTKRLFSEGWGNGGSS